MGLWDFVKDAGKSVLGEAQAAEPQTAPKQATPQAAPQASPHATQPKASPEPALSRDEADTRRKLDALNAEVAALGLDAGDVRLHLKGDTVTVVSKGADRATMEKLILAVGNVKGIARVEADLPEEAGAKTTEPVFHEVETGDNLSSIARKYLGDANRYPEIFEANKPMLSDPDRIYPGQKLRIPQN